MRTYRFYLSPSISLIRRGRQKGVVLFIALIVLIAMTLAGIGLIRSVTTGSMIAGNLAFKQSAVNAADPALDTAFNWLQAQSAATLMSDYAARGYVSSQVVPNWNSATTWQGAFPTSPTADAAGNQVQVLIHRMCLYGGVSWNGVTGAGQQQSCALFAGASTGTGSSMAVGAFKYNTAPMIYYRLTARVQGPRNTVSFIQIMVTGPRA